jgi:putative transposase
MRRDYSTERFAAYVAELKESLWDGVREPTRKFLKSFLEADSEQQMERYLGLKWHERAGEGEEREDSRNGWYERDYATSVGVIRVKVRRTRKRSFLPRWIRPLERRSPEVADLIRQAFLCGVSTRGVGRVVAKVSEEAVSAQTVSQLTRMLDAEVEKFRQAPLQDRWAYLILDGVWLKVKRAWGPQRVLLLVALGIAANGERRLLAFARAQGESQAAWEGFLNLLFQRGLRGRYLQLILTDGCAGLAAALALVYPGARHQRCWVHKMRNLREAVRRRDAERVKRAAQKIYLASNLAEARKAFLRFKWNWSKVYPPMVRRLEQDLPELLTFYQFRPGLWRKLRTTNAIERCFVEVRRRTRPMVVFTNVASVDRIIFAIFSRCNEAWKNRTLEIFTQAA